MLFLSRSFFIDGRGIVRASAPIITVPIISDQILPVHGVLLLNLRSDAPPHRPLDGVVLAVLDPEVGRVGQRLRHRVGGEQDLTGIERPAAVGEVRGAALLVLVLLAAVLVMMMRRWWWTHVVAGHVIGLGMLHVGVRQHRLPLRTAAEAEPVARPSGRCRYRLRLASY